MPKGINITLPITPDENGCWPWPGRVDDEGYGQAWRTSAHRYVWDKLRGPIDPGLQLDHLCHDPRECAGGRDCPHRRCVNPDHLEPVTPLENVRRAHRHRTHCKHGHPFDEANTYRQPGTTRRICRACNLRRVHEYNLRRSA